MAVLKDIIDNPTARFTLDGWTMERTVVVTGVTGDGHEKLLNAMNTSGIPALGTQHPSGADCYLREAIPTADDSDTVRIRFIYADPTNMSYRQQLNTIEVGGTLSQVQTNYDRLDSVIGAEYTYPVDYEYHDFSEKSEADRTVTQCELVNKFIPEHTIVKTRLEYVNPSLIAIDFVGTVNAAGWNFAPSALSGTWMCTGIVGRSNDGGESYIVTYSFQHRVDTWSTEVLFIDPYTGKPPTDLVDGVGRETYELYDIMDFNLLGL